MKQVGILGGSFTPPHQGHSAILRYVLEQGLVEEVWVLPVFKHPFEKVLAPFESRLEMCTLALGSMERVKICDIEKQLGGVSYTQRTLSELQKLNSDISFSIIVGDDAYQERHLWKEIQMLEKMARWIRIPRGPGSPIPDISARQIREYLATGKSVSHWLDPRVLQYIQQHKFF